MDLCKLVNLLKDEKTSEIKTLLSSGVSEKQVCYQIYKLTNFPFTNLFQKCDLLINALDKFIANFAQILEALLEHTIPSMRYKVIFNSRS